MVCIRYVVYVYNMALNTNIWVVLLIFGLKSDLVHGVNTTCAFPDVPQNSELTQRVDRDHVYQEGDVVKYQCKDGFSINGNIDRRCTKGQWTNVGFTCDNCTLSESPESSKYTYTDDEGNAIVPPYSVMDGRHVTVECKYDSYIYIYDYYGVTLTENITCVNGILDSVSMACPDNPEPAVKSDSCQKFKVKNGTVTRNPMGEYYVLCDQGYTLNIPKVAHEKPCSCSEGELVCFAGTKPVCKADNCEIPFDIDRRLSVHEWNRRSRKNLFGGELINDQVYVYFNCSKVIEQKYEPANRRFQCVRGKWMEADRSPVWKLNYNGTFPECREAKCDPPCQNGGVCFRDGECKCEHMTTGAICETFLCDKSCAKNGGECVKPGICGKCPKSRRGDNCEIEVICKLPSNAATYQNIRTAFSAGESILQNEMTCTQGYTLSSVKIMTCQDDGTWTNIIRCHMICKLPSNAATHQNIRTEFSAGESILQNEMKCAQGYTLSSVNVMTCQDDGTWTAIIRCHKTDFKYVVRIQKTATWYAGTDDNIYVRIYGHEKHTARFRMYGDFDRNKLVEIEFRGIDVRPIRTVVVSKDKGMIDDELSILYVSIFIEESDDYYVFTYRDQPVWLTASTPVELSISRHPEHCIHTYGAAMNRSPTRGNRGSPIGFVSLRECKQRCVTTRSITCNSIYIMHVWRKFRFCYHNTHSPDSNYFMDNTREQTRRQFVSYKRICRKP